MFSKRHYEKIAEVLKKALPNSMNEEMQTQWKNTVVKFADMFGADNPNFKRAKFLKACGYETEESK